MCIFGQTDTVYCYYFSKDVWCLYDAQLDLTGRRKHSSVLLDPRIGCCRPKILRQENIFPPFHSLHVEFMISHITESKLAQSDAAACGICPS